MGLFANFQRPSFGANKGERHAPWEDYWYDSISGYMMEGGLRVNPDRLMTLPPFWRGVRMWTDNIASFQVNVFERLDRGHRLASSHPEYYTLGRQPNPMMDSFQFWETVTYHIKLFKGAFALKEYVPAVRGGRGLRQLNLWPLHPDRVTPKRRPDRVIDYEVRTENGQPKTYGRDEIFHLRGLSSDGLNALTMPAYAANTAGNMLAVQRFTKMFFKSGVTAAVQATLSPDNDFDDEGLASLRESIKAYLTGLDQAFGVFVAPQTGIELKPIGVDPDKAQMHAAVEMGSVQACQFLGLPPGSLGDSKTPTFAASRQFRLDLVDMSFRPMTERIEAAGDSQLLAITDPDPMRYFMKFNMDALLRGDIKTRSEVHERNIRAGWETRNEARLMEDREPIEGLDEPIVALNMGNRSGGSSTRDSEARRQTRPPRMDRAAMVTLQVATTLVRKEVAAATKAATKFASDGPGWQSWLREFYGGTYVGEVAERLRLPAPVAREYASRQGMRLAERGIDTASDWEWTVAPELCELALRDYADAA